MIIFILGPIFTVFATSVALDSVGGTTLKVRHY